SDGFAHACLAGRCGDRRHREPECRAPVIARCHPDPASEAALDHQPAQVKAEAEDSLRPVATGWTGFLEETLEAARRETRPTVGDRHLEPAARRGARLH